MRLGMASPHLWVFALLNLQTLQGFLGAGNYGIARMNGGFASRVLVDFIPVPPAWGPRFRRAVALLHSQRELILKQFENYYRRSDGIALLWLEPWNGEDSLSLCELDPFFIEICRRVRLIWTKPEKEMPEKEIQALSRTTKAARIEAKETKGVLGDPWIPVDRGGGAALTVGSGGFSYRKVVEILFDQKYEPPAALDFLPSDKQKEMQIHFLVLVRGQGKTDGLHQRCLPVCSPKTIKKLRNDPERLALHKTANTLIEETIDKGARRALKTGLCKFLQGGKSELDFRDTRPDVWLELLDHAIDDIFFPHLWAITGAEDEEIKEEKRKEWQKALFKITTGMFENALNHLPTSSARRERARAEAERVFKGLLSKALDLVSPLDLVSSPESARSSSTPLPLETPA
jgi:CRISPR system Cascade subunit CasA